LSGLAKDLGQPHDRHRAGGDDVGQDLGRAAHAGEIPSTTSSTSNVIWFLQACIVGWLAERPRSPRQPPGIAEGLGFAVGGVNEVRMDRAEIVSKFVEGFGTDEYAGRHIRHAVSGIEVLNRRSAARRVSLAEDFLEVAVK